MLQKSKNLKQAFSISQKYSIVSYILDGVDNKSEYICQAIMEKSKLDMKDEDEEKMERVVYRILNEYISSGRIPSVTPTEETSSTHAETTAEKEEAGDFTPVTNKNISSETVSDLQEIMDKW